MRLSPADRVLIHGLTLVALGEVGRGDHWAPLTLDLLRRSLQDCRRGDPALAPLAEAAERLVAGRVDPAWTALAAAGPAADWHRRCLAGAWDVLTAAVGTEARP